MRKVVAGLASLLALVFMSTAAAAVVNNTLTPGATNPAVTQATIGTTICRSGYTKTVRNVSTRTKHAVYVAYGISRSGQRNYVIDHLIPSGGIDTTLNQVVNRGGVYSLNTVGVPDLSTQSAPLPKYTKLAPMIELNDPKYPSQSDAHAQQGLQFPDNLAFDGYGHLWVHEDIPDGPAPSTWTGISVTKQARDQQDELYVYVLNGTGDQIVPNPDTTGPAVSGGYKAADMRTSPGAQPSHPCENEFTGGIFGQDGKTLYINQQHFDNPTLTTSIG